MTWCIATAIVAAILGSLFQIVVILIGGATILWFEGSKALVKYIACISALLFVSNIIGVNAGTACLITFGVYLLLGGSSRCD